jgi:CP family cyanate transporter-like MFS transporter
MRRLKIIEALERLKRRHLTILSSLGENTQWANAAARRTMRNSWIAVGLWLAGVGLRLTILAVPPVILLIQTDLSLSGTEVGILSGLPVILFGIAALPGSLLVARFGALATLVAGLLIAGVVSGLRGAVLNVAVLYAATIVMSAGIAIMQPALSPLVRQWLPKRVTFGRRSTPTVLVGETLAVMLTIPLVLPLAGGSWRWAFAIWGIPLVMIAILTLALAPAPPKAASATPVAGGSWWPDFGNKLIWQVGILFGSVNSVYFSQRVSAQLSHRRRPADLISATPALNSARSRVVRVARGRQPGSGVAHCLSSSGALMLSAWSAS